MGHTATAIAADLGVSSATIGRIAKRIGLPSRVKFGRIDAPVDLFEMGEKLGATGKIADYYQVTSRRVRLWYSNAKVPLPKNKQPLDVPPGWFERVSGMTCAEACRYFNRSDATIRNLVRMTGVTLRKAPRFSTSLGIPVKQAETAVDTAAMVLRRYHTNVHRADIRLYESSGDTWGSVRGLPHKGHGQYFVAGIGVVSSDRLIEMAREKGAQL